MRRSKQEIQVEQTYHELYNKNLGRDTWYTCDEGITIANKYLCGINLMDQISLIENYVKNCKGKSLTGNCETSYKGGKRRRKCRRIPQLTPEIRKDIKNSIPSHVKGQRTYWLKTIEGKNFVYHHSKKHNCNEGEIIRVIINKCKRERQNKTGVYFVVDPARPNEFNIGRTSRSVGERLKDTGSKGRHNISLLHTNDISENEIHKLLKHWKDTSGRGSETFVFDDAAYELILNTYGIDLKKLKSSHSEFADWEKQLQFTN